MKKLTTDESHKLQNIINGMKFKDGELCLDVYGSCESPFIEIEGDITFKEIVELALTIMAFMGEKQL